MVFVDKLRRSTSLAAAALLIVASAVPLLSVQSASAYTLLGEREIRMGTSQVNVLDEDGYQVNFILTDDVTNLEGVVVTFCEESPIIGDDDCSVPTDFSLGAASISGADEGDVDLSSFTADFENVVSSGGGSNDNTLILHDSTGVAASDGDQVTFTIEDVNNPSTLGTFYARIMVYDDDTRALAYDTDGDPGETQSPDLAGGIALSTADVITIEAKVQERLEFCIHTNTSPSHDNGDCSAPVEPVVLGDDNGVLSSADPSISDEARFGITTNASEGATVRMKGDTLDSGSFTIDPIGGSAATSNEGTEQFGLCVYEQGAAGLTATAPYNSGACSGVTAGQGGGFDNGASFAFDTTQTTSAYGHNIATKDAGEWSTGALVFLGNVSNVTQPGIYTTTLDFIATGRY